MLETLVLGADYRIRLYNTSNCLACSCLTQGSTAHVGPVAGFQLDLTVSSA